MRKYDRSVHVLTFRLAATFLAVLLPAVVARGAWVDYGNGCYKDTETGLVWYDYTVNNPLWDGQNWHTNFQTFDAAQAIASNLVLLNHDDWRAPTKAEMLTAVSHGIGTSGMPLYGNSTPGWTFFWWSSDKRGNRGWAVDVHSGQAALCLKSSGLFVMCVRQDTPGP